MVFDTQVGLLASAVGVKIKAVQQTASGVPSYGLPATGVPANRYDTLRGVYNYKSSNTRILEQGLSRAMVGGVSSQLIIGDSVSAGAIAQSGAAWLFDRQRAWPMAMRDQLAMLGVPTAGTGIIRHVDSTVGADSRWVYTGTWNGASGYSYTTVATSSATLTPDRDGTIYDHLYYDSGLGTFTIAVDGVTQKTVTTNGSAGWKIARITGQVLKAGVTQIKITCTATNGGGVYSAGGSVWTPSGGLLVHNPSQSGSTASGTGMASWSDYTVGTGLGGVFDNVAGRKRTVTDAGTTVGSSTLSSATAAFTPDDVGKAITQTPTSDGPMFSGECYIGAYLTSSTVTIYSGLTNAATLAVNTTTAETVQIGRDPDCIHIALGLNDISGLSASDATITAAITTIRNRYPASDCILHLVHEMATSLISTVRATAFQKALYALADTLDVPLYDWRDRVGSFTAGQANGSYGDHLTHLTPATESDLGAQLGWIMGGGGGKTQTYQTPTVDADISNKKYVDSKLTGTKGSAFTSGTSPTPQAATLLGVESGASRKWLVSDVRRFVPFEVLVWHNGSSTTVFTGPTAAGTAEIGTAPACRLWSDLALASQFCIVVGQKVIGAGGTSQYLQLQYASNGATQTTWTTAHNSGNGLDLRTGTAQTMRSSGWIDLISGAKINDCYMRLVTVTTGTLSTAPTLSWGAVYFR